MPSVEYKNQQHNQHNQHNSDNSHQDDEPSSLVYRIFYRLVTWKVLVKGVKSVAVKENIIQDLVVQSWVKITWVSAKFEIDMKA